jgi:hypothetical protein
MTDVGFKYADEYRRCLLELDVVGIRKLWAHTNPGLPQPTTDDAALHTLHLARTMIEDFPAHLQDYSREWLKERAALDCRRLAKAVGVAVLLPTPGREAQGHDVRDAMSDSVKDSIRAGIDIDHEAAEVKRRMFLARERQHLYDNSVRGARVEKDE